MKHLLSLASLIFVVSQNLGQTLALRGCQNYVTRGEGTVYELSKHTVTGGGTRCTYNQFEGFTGPPTQFCQYARVCRYVLVLSWYPNMSGADTGCPGSLPLTPYVGKFLIKFPSGDHCATILGTPEDGAKVAIKACDKSNDYPGQAWTFDGQNIRQGKMCLDVKGGNTNNGNPLQVWTCTSFSKNPNGEANRKFDLAGGDVIFYGNGHEERFVWSGKSKCVDLPNGVTSDGNQLQTWDCSPTNPHQGWELQVVNP
ncbi:ricin B lectin domain-containing protein [Flagelloscypha sp. PMI_526]|nr:ricin B lectin domain-containing protein [Flagelloscypha sp. PMI_526]